MFSRQLQFCYEPPSRLSYLQSFRPDNQPCNAVSQFCPTLELNFETFGSRGGLYV
jgi:hypothetical protein